MPDEYYGGGWAGGSANGSIVPAPRGGGGSMPIQGAGGGAAYGGGWGGPTGWGGGPPSMWVGGYVGGWGPAPPPPYSPVWGGGYGGGGYINDGGYGGGGYDDESGYVGGQGQGGEGDPVPKNSAIEIGSNNKTEKGNNTVRLRFDLSKLKDIPQHHGGVRIASGQYARDNGNMIDFSEYDDPAPPVPQPPERSLRDRIGIRIGLRRR